MLPVCAWTGRRSDQVVPVSIPSVDRFGNPAAQQLVTVLPQHRENLLVHARSVAHWGRAFFRAQVALAILLVIAALLGATGIVSGRAAAIVAGAAVAAMGLLLVLLPFTSTETVTSMGVRRARLIGRSLGLVTMALGVVIALAA